MIFVCVLAATYGGQLAFSAFFGLYTGGQYALVNVLAVQFMGLSLLPSAFGVLVFLMGVGYVAGPPLAGQLPVIISARLLCLIVSRCGLAVRR